MTAARRFPVKPAILVLALAAVIVIGRTYGIGGRIEELRGWIAGLGPLGPLAYIGIYMVAVVAAVPGSVITLAAGALFGSVTGVVVVSVGSTLGAGLAFLVSRYLARDAVRRWVAGNETFAKLDRLTEENGAVVVALTRLTPIFPFNLLNYGFGLTRVRFRTYFFWSWLCMLPFTVVYVVFGDTLAKVSAGGGVPWPLIVTLAVSAVFVVILVRFGKRKLAEMDKAAGGEDG